jgi:hypothetical protein
MYASSGGVGCFFGDQRPNFSSLIFENKHVSKIIFLNCFFLKCAMYACSVKYMYYYVAYVRGINTYVCVCVCTCMCIYDTSLA